jgi:4'-phosphopantetheinyl transferase
MDEEQMLSLPDAHQIQQPQIGEVQLYYFRLTADEPAMQQLAQSLSRDELARADRFVTGDLRRRFIVCRGRLRQVLAALCGCSPLEVRFRYESLGKPQLVEPRSVAGLPVHFNVSHSGDAALLAIAAEEVGVDLEVPNPRTNYAAIASQMISDYERSGWDQLSPVERAEETLRLWVCKEALLKALGLGIADALKRVSFPLPIPAQGPFAPLRIDASLQLHLDEDGTCGRNHWLDPHSWKIQLLPEIPGVSAAVAMPRSILQLSIHALRIE